MARILVVDDDPQVRRMLRVRLQGAGYEVDEAPNGKWAVELQRREPADLVISDIIMPGKGGTQMISELRSLDPNLKIIAISGGGVLDAQDHLEVAEQLGAHRTFSKPVAMDELLESVEELTA